MKELSIEDKAKAYDEAIEFAHNKHRFSSNLSEIKLIEEIFPELRESEDERIISNIKKAAEYYWSDEPLQEILDWLEKQCEQKPAIKLERDDNGEAALTPFEAELFSMMSEAWQGYSFGEEVNIAKIVKEHSKELLERANEQKPAWSEEDEKLFRCAIDAVKQESKVRTDGCLDEEVGEMVTNWLKSLRPQDWTKEDKERYISCLQRLGTGNPKQPETINSKWFKEHVYPQSYWKPSDEQMEALEKECIAHSNYELCRLLEQLKKLREE